MQNIRILFQVVYCYTDVVGTEAFRYKGVATRGDPGAMGRGMGINPVAGFPGREIII
jgi:hypothetical protein